MPLIPSTVKPISMDVTGMRTDVQAPTEVEGAISGLGNDIARLSLGLYSQFKDAEAIDAVSKASFQDQLDSQDQVASLKMKYPTGYVTDEGGNKVIDSVTGTYRTVSQEYASWANDRYHANLLKMPSQVAQDMYKRQAGSYFTDSISKFKTLDLQMRSDSFTSEQNDRINALTNRLVDAPDTFMAYQGMDHILQEVKDQTGRFLDVNQAASRANSIKASVPESMFNGFINQIATQPKNGGSRMKMIASAIQILRGEDFESLQRQKAGLPTFAGTMSPDQKAEIERKLLSLRDVAKKGDISDFDLYLKNVEAQINQGDPSADIPGIQTALADLVHTGQKTPYEAADTMTKLWADQYAVKNLGTAEYALSSPQDREQMVNNVVDKAVKIRKFYTGPNPTSKEQTLSAAGIEEIRKVAKERGDQADSVLNKDFAQGVSKYDTKVGALSATIQPIFSDPSNQIWQLGQALKRRSLSLESFGDRYFGGKSPNFKYLTNDEADHLAAWLKSDVVSGGDKQNFFRGLYAQDPQRFGSYVDQLVREKKLDPEWRQVIANPNGAINADYIQTLMQGSKIVTDAKDAGQDLSLWDSAIQRAAGGALAALSWDQDSLLAQNNARALRDQIRNKAMQLAKNNAWHGSKSDYAKEAVNAVLGTRYNQLSVGGGPVLGIFGEDDGVRQTLIVPKIYAGQELSEEQLNSIAASRNRIITRADELKRLGAVPPPGATDVPSGFYSKVAESGKMVLTGDQSGYYVVYHDPRLGQDVRVVTNHKDKKGRPLPLFIPISEMLRVPAKPKSSGSILDSFTSSFVGGQTGGL